MKIRVVSLSLLAALSPLACSSTDEPSSGSDGSGGSASGSGGAAGMGVNGGTSNVAGEVGSGGIAGDVATGGDGGIAGEDGAAGDGNASGAGGGLGNGGNAGSGDNGGAGGVNAGGESGTGGVNVGGSAGTGGGSTAERSYVGVIGDSPYGATQLAAFPTLVSTINQDPDLSVVVHVGDIKNGSTACDTAYFQTIFDEVSEFAFPFVYTPGDNEWTDCHRAAAGAYDPLERLDVLRGIFFANPSQSLAVPMPLVSQATVSAHETVENQMWVQSGVVFATVHVVGSSNGLAAWFGDDMTGSLMDDPVRRMAEVDSRIAADSDWIDDAFEEAETGAAVGVVILMQADTFPATNGFQEIITTLADRARVFQKPVLLIQGDTHVYKTDQPLLDANNVYGLAPVPNMTRIVVQGETASEWLKLTIDPAGAELFSWERKFLQ
jgi:hypothetical protein